MSVFVDTSVWIEFFKGRAAVADELRVLLDEQRVALAAPVWLEILSGARKSEFARLRRVLSALPRFFPTESTWATCEEWIELATAAGERFAVADLLIGATCVETGSRLWSLDKDFRRMERLGLVKLHAPRP